MTEPPDPFNLAHLAEDFCLAESQNHYLCGREPGHEGWRRAEDSETHEVWDTWP